MGKKIVTLIIVGVIIVVGLILTPQIFDTVEKGTYQIKQAAISGKMTAKMTPGLWWQNFGDIDVFPNQETFFFTADKDTPDDVAADESIEVRFVDGSLSNISGTCRIIMPRAESDAIALVVEDGYKTYRDVAHKLILPTLRNVLRHTANMMTARESYAEKRQEYVMWARDQLENGLYRTTTEERDVVDLVSGEKGRKTFKIILRIKGSPQYEFNPLTRGIRVANFEIKDFGYGKIVKKQIQTQQEALMAVATAQAKAKRAEMEKLREKAEGEQKVMKAKYEEEQVKVRAIVVAQREKEVQELDARRDKQVAITLAEKRKETAKLDKDAAGFKKQEQILLGEGEAKRKQLVLAADGALAQKLSTYENVMTLWANAYSKRKVPSVMMGNGGEGRIDTNAISMSEVLSLMAMKQLGLDFSIPKGTVTKQ